MDAGCVSKIGDELFVAEGAAGIDEGGAAGGNVCGKQSYEDKEHGGVNDGEWIVGMKPKEERACAASGGERDQNAEKDSGSEHAESLS